MNLISTLAQTLDFLLGCFHTIVLLCTMVKHGGRSAACKANDRRNDADAKKRHQKKNLHTMDGASRNLATGKHGRIDVDEIDDDMSRATKSNSDFCRTAHWSCPLWHTWHTGGHDERWEHTPPSWHGWSSHGCMCARLAQCNFEFMHVV